MSDSDSDSRYREYPPSAALDGLVSCFWSRSSLGGEEIRVLPDGAIDILFDLAAGSSREVASVVGTMTRPLTVARPPSSRSDFVAVRLRPGAANAFLGVPARELTDRRETLSSVCPWASDWAERLAGTSDVRQRVRVLDGLLRSRVENARTARPDPRVMNAIRAIGAACGNVSVELVSGELGITRQQLTRLFDRHVGVGFKLFARIERVSRLVETLPAEGDRPDWAGLAIDFGFYDQAHMGADFRELTGLTPGQFLRQGAPV